MNRNQKLSTVVRGRTIASSSLQGSRLTITFADQSTLEATLDGAATLPTRTVAAVYQDGTHLRFSFEDQTTAEVELDPQSTGVLVRSASGTLEYVG